MVKKIHVIKTRSHFSVTQLRLIFTFFNPFCRHTELSGSNANKLKSDWATQQNRPIRMPYDSGALLRYWCARTVSHAASLGTCRARAIITCTRFPLGMRVGTLNVFSQIRRAFHNCPLDGRNVLAIPPLYCMSSPAQITLSCQLQLSWVWIIQLPGCDRTKITTKADGRSDDHSDDSSGFIP